MRVIGIDPGIERTGFAILEKNENGKVAVRDCGCIKTNRNEALGARLVTLAEDLRPLLRKWKPGAAALEQVFFSRNVKTAIDVSHARGVIVEILEEYGVPLTEFNPTSLKQQLTGDGRADKLQIKKMIQILLGYNVANDDTADALACGYCLLTSITI